MRPSASALVLFGVLAACSDDARTTGGRDAGALDAAAPDAPFEVPAVTIPEPGLLRTAALVPGHVPAPNPVTGAASPDRYNATRVVRYQLEGAPDPRAILVLVPGIFGGAGSLDPLARAIVLSAKAAGLEVEVWSIDRRSNLLEDQRGVDAAEAAGDAEIAYRYYAGTRSAGGERFAGFRRPGDVSFQSEWGLATHIEDLRRVMALVPKASRRGHVFLGGHSLGGLITQVYGAWRFDDGSLGTDELAGLVLLDSALRNDEISEAEYHGGHSGALFPSPGVDEIRRSAPYIELPFLGPDVFPVLDIAALRVLFDPTGIIRTDDARNGALAFFLGLGKTELPAMTHRGALGFGFDYGSNPIDIFGATLGTPTGGAVELRPSLTGTRMLRFPSDPAATYDWQSAPGGAAGWTPLDALAHATVDGRTDLAEWYFPARLSIDLEVAGDLRVPEGGWQAREGLRAFDGARIDAPLLAVSAGHGITQPASYEPLRARIGPLSADRPAGALPRRDPRAFRVVDVPSMSHLDVTLAVGATDNPIPPTVVDFLGAHAAAGSLPSPTLP